MQSYHLDQQGDIEGLILRSHDDPKPGPREALVRVHASSLNYRDIMILEGRYGRVRFRRGLVHCPMLLEKYWLLERALRASSWETKCSATHCHDGSPEGSRRMSSPSSRAQFKTEC